MASRSDILKRTLLMMPRLTRSLVRVYLRRIGRVPASTQWFVDDLCRRLVASMPIAGGRLGEGLVLEVGPCTAQGAATNVRGTCEPEGYGFLKRTIKPGMVVVDAGANVGELTLRASALAGPTGRVISIEASPLTADHL